MIEISNVEKWIEDYFKDPENIKKAEKACERYDRLMVKNVRRQMMMGVENITVVGEGIDDPGKVLEKAKYEIIPFVKADGVKGKIRLNMLDRTGEFITD